MFLRGKKIRREECSSEHRALHQCALSLSQGLNCLCKDHVKPQLTHIGGTSDFAFQPNHPAPCSQTRLVWSFIPPCFQSFSPSGLPVHSDSDTMRAGSEDVSSGIPCYKCSTANKDKVFSLPISNENNLVYCNLCINRYLHSFILICTKVNMLRL